MLPGEFFVVMGLAGFTAFGAGVKATALSSNTEPKLVGTARCIKVLIDYFPRCLQTEAKHKDLISIHG